ncbi:hypothetical protein TSUD_05220 [Trifolium subterraneum]|uniref:Uncharacterized protein n=1 Tax=Trifolium subterraneum TaxID=3900 RepID=A0A2Z6M5I8_TRISU|nr:hypothetical protein TSUD_05220 [Trifolium subterraneum]
MDVSSKSSMTENLQKLLPLSWSLIVIQDELIYSYLLLYTPNCLYIKAHQFKVQTDYLIDLCVPTSQKPNRRCNVAAGIAAEKLATEDPNRLMGCC